MTRSRIGKRIKKIRRPGTNVFQKITIPSQKSRKVVFLGKEPKPKFLPEDIYDFIEDTETEIPPKQVQFYEESENIIFSNDLRPKKNIEEMKYDSIPYQWISPKFWIHDLTTKHSQDFRCNWFKRTAALGRRPRCRIAKCSLLDR